jgi:hypothetical protein
MNKIKNKWIVIIIKYLSLPFSLFISFVSIYKTIRIIFYTNDNNRLLMIDLTIIVFLILGFFILNIFFSKRFVLSDCIKFFANNFKVFISLFLLLTSSLICFTYYVNYKFGKTRMENCTIKNKLFDDFKSMATYEILSDCDEFPDIMVNKEFYCSVKNGMEISFVINDGIMGFPVLLEIKGKDDDSLLYRFDR